MLWIAFTCQSNCATVLSVLRPQEDLLIAYVLKQGKLITALIILHLLGTGLCLTGWISRIHSAQERKRQAHIVLFMKFISRSPAYTNEQPCFYPVLKIYLFPQAYITAGWFKSKPTSAIGEVIKHSLLQCAAALYTLSLLTVGALGGAVESVIHSDAQNGQKENMTDSTCSDPLYFVFLNVW